MLKLIQAEFYKIFRRLTFFVLLVSLPLLAVALVLIAIRGRNAGTLTGAFLVAPQLLSYPAALLPLITEFTLGEELRERTMKNTIEYGIGRGTYFVSKLISTLLLGILFVVLVYGTYFATAALSMPLGKGIGTELVHATCSRIAAASAVYAAASALSLFLLTGLNRNVSAIFAYYGLFYFTEPLLKAFKLSNGVNYLLSTQVSALTGEDPPQFGFILAVSAVTFAVFCIGSLIVLQKKDLA